MLQEWGLIKSSSNEDDQLKEFCRHWSLKESYVKATGTGITVNLQELSFQTQNNLSTAVITDSALLKKGDHLSNWTFEESVLDSDHCVSVARNFNCPPEAFQFLDIADLLYSHELDLHSRIDHNYTANFMLKDERP